MAAHARRRRRVGDGGGDGEESALRRVPTTSPTQPSRHPTLGIDIDPATRFFYTPHTVIGLVIGVCWSFGVC
jgi:hypothetical protein